MTVRQPGARRAVGGVKFEVQIAVDVALLNGLPECRAVRLIDHRLEWTCIHQDARQHTGGVCMRAVRAMGQMSATMGVNALARDHDALVVPIEVEGDGRGQCRAYKRHARFREPPRPRSATGKRERPSGRRREREG